MTFLLGLFLNLRHIVSRFWSWVSATPARLIIVALIALSAFLALSNYMLRGQVKHWKQRYTVEATAHITTKTNYAKAQKEAAALNKAQVAAIKKQYDAIAETSERNYEKNLADNRTNLAKWLRSKAAQSSASGTGTSSPAEMPAEPLQDASQALVPVSDLEIAADNYSQLMALREWALEVGEVNR